MSTTLVTLRAGTQPLSEVGEAIRAMLREAELPQGLATEIGAAYPELAHRTGTARPSVAVRSSATAEDLPDASFAGQQETYLNVAGEAALNRTTAEVVSSHGEIRNVSYGPSQCGHAPTQLNLEVVFPPGETAAARCAI